MGTDNGCAAKTVVLILSSARDSGGVEIEAWGLRSPNRDRRRNLAIEFCEEQPEGQVIEDLSAWRREIDGVFNPIHRAFYELALFTGFRKAELLTLEWKHVRKDRIHLPMTKNGRSFDLPINERHLEILKPLRKPSRKWVFPSPKSPKGHVGAPERISWRPHAHRRTFATVAMEAGVLEEIVGRLLNHTPISITGQRYVRPSLDSLRPAMDKICVELDKRIHLGRGKDAAAWVTEIVVARSGCGG